MPSVFSPQLWTAPATTWENGQGGLRRAAVVESGDAAATAANITAARDLRGAQTYRSAAARASARSHVRR